MSVKSLISQIQTYNPDAEVELLERCYRFAQKAHKGQRRKSGEPYFTHCLKTAEILAELRLDTHTICAGLMHDVLEDTGITREEMKVRFGANIANLVEGVTKIGQYKLGIASQAPAAKNTVEQRVHRKRQAETYRKLLLATAEDMRVISLNLQIDFITWRRWSSSQVRNANALQRKHWKFMPRSHIDWGFGVSWAALKI